MGTLLQGQNIHAPVPGKLGFKLSVKSRKQSSGSVLKSHRFSSSFGCASVKVQMNLSLNIVVLQKVECHKVDFVKGLTRFICFCMGSIMNRSWYPVAHLKLQESGTLEMESTVSTTNLREASTLKKGCCNACSAVGLLRGSQEQSRYQNKGKGYHVNIEMCYWTNNLK